MIQRFKGKRTISETRSSREEEKVVGAAFFLDGEIPMCTPVPVDYVNPMLRSRDKGYLHVTNYRIIFASNDEDVSPDAHCSIPIACIESISKKKRDVMIECKDVRKLVFVFLSKENVHHFLDNRALQPVIHSTTLITSLTFAFFQRPFQNPFLPYSPEQTCSHFEKIYPDFHKKWRLSTANENFEICKTYPKYFIVPLALSDEDMVEVSKERSKERLPILSYVHSSGASITRCAQPTGGVMNKFGHADQMMIRLLMATNPDENASLVIADARPKINADANRLNGGGYEDPKNYRNASLHFLNIDNIHVIRESYQSMKKVCIGEDVMSKVNWLSAVDSSHWLHHLSRILAGSNLIAQAIVNGANVLCHCSDGWDRTAQLCSLAQILLDPFCRTIQGFLYLIEKEWIQCGHKFNDRVGHDPACKTERSPVFLQFLECMWQLKQQHPTAFEFTESLLLDLSSALHSCRFGTFLLNCEKEREEIKLRTRTPCLWTYIERNKPKYLNSRYIRDDSVLKINYEMMFLRVWRSYFLQYVTMGSAEHIDLELDILRTTEPAVGEPVKDEESEKYINSLLSLLKQHNIEAPSRSGGAEKLEEDSSFSKKREQLSNMGNSFRMSCDLPEATKKAKRRSTVFRNKVVLTPKPMLDTVPPPLISAVSSFDRPVMPLPPFPDPNRVQPPPPVQPPRQPSPPSQLLRQPSPPSQLLRQPSPSSQPSPPKPFRQPSPQIGMRINRGSGIKSPKVSPQNSSGRAPDLNQLGAMSGSFSKSPTSRRRPPPPKRDAPIPDKKSVSPPTPPRSPNPPELAQAKSMHMTIKQMEVHGHRLKGKAPSEILSKTSFTPPPLPATQSIDQSCLMKRSVVGGEESSARPASNRPRLPPPLSATSKKRGHQRSVSDMTNFKPPLPPPCK